MPSTIHVPVVLALVTTAALSGCSWSSPSQPKATHSSVGSAQVPADAVQLAVPNLSGGGTVLINVMSVDGEGRAVQFLPRAKRFSDIQSFKFDLLDATTDAVRYSLTTNTVKTSAYTITNLPAPDSLKIRVTAYSAQSAGGSILNAGGTGVVSSAVSVVDQSVSATSITMNLADGYDANGDIAATVAVTDGATQSLPAVAID